MLEQSVYILIIIITIRFRVNSKPTKNKCGDEEIINDNNAFNQICFNHASFIFTRCTCAYQHLNYAYLRIRWTLLNKLTDVGSFSSIVSYIYLTHYYYRFSSIHRIKERKRKIGTFCCQFDVFEISRMHLSVECIHTIAHVNHFIANENKFSLDRAAFFFLLLIELNMWHATLIYAN